MHWFTEPVMNHYADFEGRTSRKAFWMFALFHIIFTIVVNIIGSTTGLEILAVIYALGIFLPALAISVRRLHDVNKSGWWVLLSFIPILGFLILLFFYVKPGDAGANQYGSSPNGGGSNGPGGMGDEETFSSADVHSDVIPTPPSTDDVPKPPQDNQMK